jgi:hypothetical protein
MPDLIKWKEKIEKGLDALLENKRELELRINRQEGALMMVNELIRDEEQAVNQPAEVVAEVEPVA